MVHDDGQLGSLRHQQGSLAIEVSTIVPLIHPCYRPLLQQPHREEASIHRDECAVRASTRRLREEEGDEGRREVKPSGVRLG